MGNTVTKSGAWVEVSAMDSDFSLCDELGVTKVKLLGIFFTPGATDNLLIIREGSITGPRISFKGADTYDQRFVYLHGSPVDPWIDFSECTFSGTYWITYILWPHKR